MKYGVQRQEVFAAWHRLIGIAKRRQMPYCQRKFVCLKEKLERRS